MSYLFDGVDDFIAQDAPTWVAPTQQTLIYWIKPASFGGGSRGRVWSPHLSSNVAALGGASFVDNVNVASGIGFIRGFDNTDGYWGAAGTINSLDGWVGVAITYNSSSVANDPAIWTREIANSEAALTSRTVTEVQTPVGDPWAADEYFIGVNDPLSITRQFEGRIAHIQVFNRILSESEMNAALSSPGSVTSGLILHQRLDDDTLDDGPNGFDATATGATLDADNPPISGGGGGSSPLLLILSRLMDADVRQKDATNQSFDVMFLDATTGEPMTGLVAADITLKYRRAGAALVSAISESDLAALTDAHSDGGVKEIGDGLYRVDYPDAAFATGADRVTLFGSATGAVMVPIKVTLSGYDPIADGADAASIADAVGELVVEGTTTVVESLRLHNAALGAKSTNGGKTYRDLADTKDRIAATIDGSKNRTAVTLDLT
jgi:hypothetical protein